MSQIIPLLDYEEGYREMPYYDSLGYPTAGTGILLGPKGTPLSHYTFTVPKDVSDVWLQNLVKRKVDEMQATPEIAAAMKACNGPRQDILISMAYQMGINGLAKFINTLALIAAGNFTGAAAGMLNSAWARQTPSCAKRHAEVMRTGVFATYQGLL